MQAGLGIDDANLNADQLPAFSISWICADPAGTLSVFLAT